MQVQEFEREAMRRVPSLLATLLDVSVDEIRLEPSTDNDRGIDAVVDAAGRRWLFELKSSASPGVVALAAKQLLVHAESGIHAGVPVLVVPYMGHAGAGAAGERELNWIDLSGNARLRDGELYVRVDGRPNQFPQRGRPSTPFAPKSARVARFLLADPQRWWRQKDLADVTDLDDGHLSRVVRRLDEELLLDHRDGKFRPRDPGLLLDAWVDDYRFDRHDVVSGHLTGTGTELVAELDGRLAGADVRHAFTGLPAAWVLGHHARFRLASVYVEGDPRDAADAIGLRREERGANVQLIGPDDAGVFDCGREVDGLACVSPSQVYLDLLNLPERAREAADDLRDGGLLWNHSG